MQLTGEVTNKTVEEYQRQVGDFKEAARRGTVQMQLPAKDNDGAYVNIPLVLDGKAAEHLDEFKVGQKVTLTLQVE